MKLNSRIFLAILSSSLLLATTGCFRVSTETLVLRDCVLENTPSAEWEQQVELGVGRLTLGVLQLGGAVASRWVDIPQEARAILNSAKGVNASIHQLRSGNLSDLQPQKVLAQADKSMEKRGWYRLVGVVNDHELVAVYVPENADLARDAEVAVLVLSGKDLVCAGARSDLRPIYQMAMEKARGEFPELANRPD